MIRAVRTSRSPAAIGRSRLVGMETVDLGVVGVVEEVGAAGREAEADERHQRLQQRVALVEHPGRGGRREDQDVLGPLLRPGGADRRLHSGGPPRASGIASGVAPRRIVGPPTSRQGYRPDRGTYPWPARRPPYVAVNTGAGRRLRPTWHRRSTRARATTAAPGCCTAGASARTRRGPTRTARSTKPSRRSASPGPRPSAARSSTSCSSGCNESCSWSAPSSPPRPRTGRSSSPGSPSRPTTMVTALEPVIDDITARYDAPDRVRAAGREPRRGGARRRAHGRAAGRAPGGRGRRATAGSTTAQVVPYLNRLADLVYTLARWQEGTFRPVRTDRSP